LFHNKEVFFAPALPLEGFLTQQAGDTGGFAGFIHKAKTFHENNMKMPLSMVQI
jgi:hypothetical protein